MEFLDFISQIDHNLLYFITKYEKWIYLILFLIIFIKTGVGILSFVPGETLLVATGIAASQEYLEFYFCLVLLIIAAILGSFLNYITGKYLGRKVLDFKMKNKPLIKPESIEKIQIVFEKYGAKILILVRFIPMLRSVAPFTAGVSKMDFYRFSLYSIIGGFLWVSIYICIGYFFGNIF